jgi:hypothetical protein
MFHRHQVINETWMTASPVFIESNTDSKSRLFFLCYQYLGTSGPIPIAKTCDSWKTLIAIIFRQPWDFTFSCVKC